MKKILFVVLFFLIAAHVSTAVFAGNVTIQQLDDRFRIEVDGELFTEWQFAAWKAPYLYPVIGPTGENITRHYPMKPDVEGEDHDHPHHRSIRFSHRDVDGFSFWAPDAPSNKNEAEIVFEKVEKITEGEKGELIFWNRWNGDGKLMLRERVRLAFIPQENRQMLMDYDIELFADEKPVTFKDEKDGGLGVRVAGTMKVVDRKTKEGKGTIVNSEGLKNEAAWGKRAEWCDYYGPLPGGEIAGIAIFDHPGNLRYPTHWHARTYGLLTANRFGKGFFEKADGATKGEGDYTIKAGTSLKLRHRLYFHLGSALEADVAGKNESYKKE